ncbi:MAG TPA: sulfotransferase family protein [Planctomycetes bacterium]|nr:sulfotransferase family protein [Planctomycetota bacterium]
MLQVIGLGYPRTGTMSLKHALEELLLGPCYHMIEVFDRPGDVDFWLSALRDNGLDADWDTLFEDFQSTADCPACYFWESLWRRFPDARYILTVRDADTWYDSFHATVYEAMMHPERAPDQQHLAVQNMARKLILETMFEGRFEDREFAINRYQAHNKSVVDTLPKEKLLVFDVAEGWQPLCEFLNVDVPETSFPRSNTRAEFQQRFAVVPPTDM